jgi:hypothetical protein
MQSQCIDSVSAQAGTFSNETKVRPDFTERAQEAHEQWLQTEEEESSESMAQQEVTRRKSVPETGPISLHTKAISLQISDQTKAISLHRDNNLQNKVINPEVNLHHSHSVGMDQQQEIDLQDDSRRQFSNNRYSIRGYQEAVSGTQAKQWPWKKLQATGARATSDGMGVVNNTHTRTQGVSRP